MSMSCANTHRTANTPGITKSTIRHTTGSTEHQARTRSLRGRCTVAQWGWILVTTAAISVLAWIGLLLLALDERRLYRILPVLVAFAAGTLLAGAILHLLMEAIDTSGPRLSVFLWFIAGFALFFLIELYLQWRHRHLPGSRHVHEQHKEPVTYMVLLADGLHNFIGGLAIGGSFVVSVRVGLITALAAAAHEIPQEIGDFGILVHGGWDKRRALVYN
ncbi:MAG: hypothetical protein GF331_24210, partial [Chitinivibrionales bacterium]|nr:hypothetical protein [Chitinivibrionales bacterium]